MNIDQKTSRWLPGNKMAFVDINEKLLSQNKNDMTLL